MRDFPSCFSENGVQVADSSSSCASAAASSSTAAKAAQNVVTCLYQCRIRGRSCLITLSWTKSLMGQGLTLGIEDSSNQCLCKFEIKPWLLFYRKKGSRSSEAYSCKIDVHWDLSSAKFGSGSPEPQQWFYVAVVVDKQMILLLGDMTKEAFKKTSASAVLPLTSCAVFVAKREHLFGKKVFSTKAQFRDNGQVHDLVLECDTIGVSDPCLVVRLDCKTVLQVKRLKWKFRGNHTMLVDGLAVEVLWDVHNWLFGGGGGGSVGNAVFMFRTSLEKMRDGRSQQQQQQHNEDDDDPSRLTWSSFSQRIVECKSPQNPEFKLVLYAWKSE